MSLRHDTDPAPVGELVAAWVGAKLAEVVVLLRALEVEVAELRKAARR
jgi:hypothetical protein